MSTTKVSAAKSDDAVTRHRYRCTLDSGPLDGAELVCVEYPPDAPYAAWAQKIDDDWQEATAAFQAVRGLSDEQRAAAADALYRRRQQLADYLTSQENSFADWQHELWRLAEMEAASGVNGVEFEKTRIAEKKTAVVRLMS